MATAALICLLWAALGAAHADAGVTVDAGTALVLGEQPDISARLFGVTAFEGFTSVVADRDYRARLAALRPGCVRFGGNLDWCSPPAFDPAWYDTPAADREFTQVLLFGNRYPTGRFLPIVRELGAEPMCSLAAPPPYLAQTGSSRPADFDRWAQACAAYVGLWRRHDPAFRLVQIWNEPNADWFKDPRVKRDGPSAADLHIDMANRVSAAIKQRFPDMQVGGPVLCWPPGWPRQQAGQPPWYTWDQWTLPWLKGTAHSIDFFDFHVYDVSPDDFAVQVEMLANAARLIQSRRLPIWITESNYSLADNELADAKAVWRKRVLPYERYLLRGVLPQADKIDGNLYHDLHARSFTLLPRGAEDPDATYWLLWLLRDLRGRRVVADSADPDVPAFATIEDDAVTVVLFNDSAAPKDIPLRAALPAGGWWTGPDVRAIADGAPISVTFKPARRGKVAEGTVTLPAYASASIVFRLDRFATPGPARVVREFFGDVTRAWLAQPVSVKLSVPPLPKGAQARLRVGLLGCRGDEKLAATCNGVELPLRAVALQELPMQPAADNVVEIRERQASGNAALALAFASVVVTSTKDGP